MARVLVIDDDEFMRNLMGQVLAASGYTVSTANDGRSGITLHDAEPFDLIVTDVVMPDMDGLEVVTNLRRRFTDLKIVVVSGRDKDYLELAKRKGASATIEKPIDPFTFLETINGLLA